MKTFPIQLTLEMWKACKLASLNRGLPMYAWILEVISDELERLKIRTRTNFKVDNE